MQINADLGMHAAFRERIIFLISNCRSERLGSGREESAFLCDAENRSLASLRNDNLFGQLPCRELRGSRNHYRFWVSAWIPKSAFICV